MRPHKATILVIIALAGCATAAPHADTFQTDLKRIGPACARNILAEYFSPNIKSASDSRIVAEITPKHQPPVTQRLVVTLDPIADGRYRLGASLEYITGAGTNSERSRPFPLIASQKDELAHLADRIDEQCVKL